MQPIASPDQPVVPTECPACGATDLRTTSKTIDDATYWRCVVCGEIWNVGRRRSQLPWPGGHRPWRSEATKGFG